MRRATPLLSLTVVLALAGCSTTTVEAPGTGADAAETDAAETDGAGRADPDPDSTDPDATHPADRDTADTDPADTDPADTDPADADPAASGPPAPDSDSDPGPLAAALALAPADTAYLTITDWARIKARLGASDLTSESIQTDRIEFWRAVPSSTVLLTDGVLRAENSRLGIRYAVTQDDARWEVAWLAGGEPEGEGRGGLALRLRDDLDLDGLQRAVSDEVAGLEGAEVLPDQHLLLRQGATDAGLSTSAAMTAVLADEAETQLAVPGCLGWPTALGIDATIEDQEAVASTIPVEDLLDPEAWGMAFAGRQAVVTVVYPEGTSQDAAEQDAQARLELAEAWPTTESVGWGDALGLPPGLTGAGFVVGEEGGRVVARADYRVVNPTAAATVALAGLVPWAVCSEVDWLAEPTGL